MSDSLLTFDFEYKEAYTSKVEAKKVQLFERGTRTKIPPTHLEYYKSCLQKFLTNKKPPYIYNIWQRFCILICACPQLYNISFKQ